MSNCMMRRKVYRVMKKFFSAFFHPCSSKSKKKQFGFLLLEAILAITLISVGSAAIMRTYTTSLAAGVVSQQYVVASNLIEEKLWDILSLTDISTAETSGTFPEPFNQYSFEVKIEERMPELETDLDDMVDEGSVSSAADNVEEAEEQVIYILYTIDVVVSWEYRGDGKELTYQTATIRKQDEEDMGDLIGEF